MIAHETLVAYSPSRPDIYLGPYDETDLAQYVPYPQEYNRYNPVSATELTMSAAEITAWEEREHYLTWGIFAEKPTTENFIGTVGLSESNAGSDTEPIWSHLVQEIHIGLFSQRWHNKGIGTIAMLTASEYAFTSHDTEVIQAQTSEHNIGMHRALPRLGFTHTASYDHFTFVDGGQTQLWELATPRAQQYFADKKDSLAKGWRDYQASLRTVSIEIA